MCRQIFIAFAALLLSIQVNSTALDTSKIGESAVSPRDLLDEAKELVEALRATTRAAIFAAYNDIDLLVREIYNHRDNSMDAARVDIRQEYETLSGQLIVIKDLGETAGVDISTCLNGPEEALASLPQTIIDTLLDCLAFSNREVTIIQNDSRYKVSIVINEVEVFDFQLEVCQGEILCIAPIVTQIEIAEVEIPQKIEIELERARELIEDLKVLITECTDGKIAQMAAEGNAIVASVTRCAEDLIGR